MTSGPSKLLSSNFFLSAATDCRVSGILARAHSELETDEIRCKQQKFWSHFYQKIVLAFEYPSQPQPNGFLIDLSMKVKNPKQKLWLMSRLSILVVC